MSEKEVRVVSTEVVPGENRPIVASTVIWSGKHPEIMDAVKSLQKYARENNWDDIVGMRIMPTQGIYNAGGYDVNSFPGLIISYIVYGTYVRYGAVS
jgi:hypothetical protein